MNDVVRFDIDSETVEVFVEHLQNLWEQEHLETANDGIPGDLYGISTGPLPNDARAERVRQALAALLPADTYQEVDLGGLYAYAQTLAPEAYDGFGTLTLAQQQQAQTQDLPAGLVRTVAILKQHLDWQVGRYRSGLNATVLVPA